MHDAPQEVYVLAAEACELARPEAGIGGHVDQEPIVLRHRLAERADLLNAEEHRLLSAHGRQPSHPRAGVGRQEVQLDRLAENCREDGMHLAHGAWRSALTCKPSEVTAHHLSAEVRDRGTAELGVEV